MTTTTALPHWDMTVVYPSLDSPEFDRDFQSVIQNIDALTSLFERYHVDRQDRVSIDTETVSHFEQIIETMSALREREATVDAYIFSFVATDSRDTVAQARMSELETQGVRLSQLWTRFTAWIGSLDVEALIERSAVAREHAYMLRRDKTRAMHLMSPPEEALAAELNVTGGTAWSKLHGNLTSQLSVPIEQDGQVETVPMSVLRNMAFDADRDVRRRAFEAEIRAWEGGALPLAAALNSIKGETNTLVGRRGWGSALDMALFNNSIDRRTLDAMLEAARAAFPDCRRYLHAKARALGLPILAWYDLFAPLDTAHTTWDYTDGVDFITDQFGTFSSQLAGFAARAFRERWIDAEPRPGKSDGGFCMPLRADESRILVNYTPSYDGVSTLAHELGHAYHNYNLARRPVLLRAAPSTLAETASIFCQSIIQQAALERAGIDEQITILEDTLQNASQLVLDITSRFLFEQAVFEKRRWREMSIPELNEQMLDTQRETYADGLDESTLHPYMWAVKGHYYSVSWPYYNFPYMFGLLFGLGLYARYRADPEAFKANYDELLSSTGMADAATLASSFDIDIQTPDFWHSSLDVIGGDIDRFERLLMQRG